MTPAQRAAAERLIAEHPTLFMNDLPDWCDDAFHLLRELLAAEPVQDEPVAWLKTMYSGTRPILEVDHRKPPATNSIPVYAAPQQRKPLSADQIRDAVNDPAFWATSKNFIFRIARAIERAHGIGEQE